MTRNPIAKALRSKHVQQQIVRPRKGKGSYQRRTKHRAANHPCHRDRFH